MPSSPAAGTARLPANGNGSATNMIGSGIISPGEIEQLFLGIWKAAFGGDAAKLMRKLAIMLAGVG
jgi:hypothetical protein